ncbi:MAG TPA: group I intron-associated PD-(D/E)XK endonuclease [Chloroflexia bacterium]|nr:group I intron-associated PD-(D/E)XK endonuclease [Chloroflexia bacterium]
MPPTTVRGNLSEAKILAALVEAGYIVSEPFGDGHKYDYVIDDGVTLQRLQCKTGRLKRGCVEFNAYSVAGNSNGTRRGYSNLADVFGVYCPDTEQVYLVPVAQVGVGPVFLRIDPTQNNQQKRVRWAGDYEIVPIGPSK